MGQFFINGGKRLNGEIHVSGSKNAALPLIFASICTHGTSTFTNVPNISDVDITFDILRGMGACVSRVGSVATVDTTHLTYALPSEECVSKIRASTYLIGSCLARFGRAEIQRFGGCNFDNRPIDMHLSAALALGAEIDGNELVAERLRGAEIRFDKISVGATVNAIIMTASAEGKSRIYGYAREPHVISLIDYLRASGAQIHLCEEYIEVIGASLSGADFKIIPDMIEAGSYLSLSLMTNSELRIIGADFGQLESFLEPLIYSGAVVEYDDESVTVLGSLSEPMNVTTAPYPAFPTDLQPQTAPLLARFFGGRIAEGVWHNRFGYLSELSKFGISYAAFDGYADVFPAVIKAATATAPDLRGGMALVIAALACKGESVIFGAELIKRGYADLVEKLRLVGADIKEI